MDTVSNNTPNLLNYELFTIRLLIVYRLLVLSIENGKYLSIIKVTSLFLPSSILCIQGLEVEESSFFCKNLFSKFVTSKRE